MTEIKLEINPCDAKESVPVPEENENKKCQNENLAFWIEVFKVVDKSNDNE